VANAKPRALCGPESGAERLKGADPGGFATVGIFDAPATILGRSGELGQVRHVSEP
jgi:hypothetical protein